MRFTIVLFALAAISAAAPANGAPRAVAARDDAQATTVAATTLPATTLAASTVSATVITVSSSVTAPAASSSTTATATTPGNVDCVVAPEDLPSAATSGTAALPSPTGTFVGSFTGTGHQNYNCTSGNSTAAPVSIGANANLTGTCGSGVHSFDNPTTPRFNMSMLGDSTASKFATMASPDGASNVAWLNLKVLTSTGSIVEVYRVNTQGGQPSAQCGTQTGTIFVDYQATYYFYQSTS